VDGTINERMKVYATQKTGKPRGQVGPNGANNYNLGQSQELFLHSLDFITDELEKLSSEIEVCARWINKKVQDEKLSRL
jgi:hypothetical protein